jgi:GntR family transcriptional regulator
MDPKHVPLTAVDCSTAGKSAFGHRGRRDPETGQSGALNLLQSRRLDLLMKGSTMAVETGVESSRSRVARRGDAARPESARRAPAYQRVLEDLEGRIRTAELPPGTRLPGERDLARDFGVSRATLRQALDELELAGLLTRVPGRRGGTFVAQVKVERDLRHLAGVPAYLRSQGFTAGTRVVTAQLTPASPRTAASLGLDADAYVYDIVRIRLADGEPISLEHARFPAARFPGLLELPLGGSLYEALAARYDTVPDHAVERIEPVLARRDEAAALAVSVGAALLSIERVAYTLEGMPVEHSHDLFRGDRTRVIAWVNPHHVPEGRVSEAPAWATHAAP